VGAGSPAQRKKPKMSTVAWGKATEGLRLGLSVPAENQVRMHLENVGAAPLEVWSHVNAGEYHFDWYHLQIEDSRGDRQTLRLVDARERSAAVSTTLKSGESLAHTVDVLSWSTRRVNEANKPLAAGAYRVSAVYEVKNDDKHWHGHLEAGPVTLTITPR
jgi:hypothetical protein